MLLFLLHFQRSSSEFREDSSQRQAVTICLFYVALLESNIWFTQTVVSQRMHRMPKHQQESDRSVCTVFFCPINYQIRRRKSWLKHTCANAKWWLLKPTAERAAVRAGEDGGRASDFRWRAFYWSSSLLSRDCFKTWTSIYKVRNTRNSEVKFFHTKLDRELQWKLVTEIRTNSMWTLRLDWRSFVNTCPNHKYITSEARSSHSHAQERGRANEVTF